MGELRDKLLTVAYAKGDGGREKMLAADLAAYKRLRQQGLQPPGIDGCAILEQQGVTREEIETGAIRTNPNNPLERKKVAKERRAAILRGKEYAFEQAHNLMPKADD